MLILDQLVTTIRKSAVFNADAQVAPACILWPDRERQWTGAIARLQAVVPELFVLGAYEPERRTGPAIWLRCVLAGKLLPAEIGGEPTLDGTKRLPPILYLPGYSRQDLRAVDTCPEPIKPLAELQFRGVIWSQANARDWTILAFLKSELGGLGLDVAQDNDAKNAMQAALNRLLEEDAVHLRDRHLDSDYFNMLLSGDPVRELLQWLDKGDGFRRAHSEDEWRAFVAVTKSQFAFDPETQGTLAAATLLANQMAAWRTVWERYCEAPGLYPNVPQQIRRCAMPASDLFSGATTHGGWPQWNESQENALRQDLFALGDQPEHHARTRLVELEKQHAARRSLVWAALGEAPLAIAMEHLAILGVAAAHSLAGGSVDDLAAGYRAGGWRADAGMLGALAAVSKPDDIAAVTAVLGAVYGPWAEASARHLQKVVEDAGYPGGTAVTASPPAHRTGDCVLFVDGLRYDLAQRLAGRLRALQCTVAESMTWAALPSVTATGKPSVTPIREQIRGQETNVDFEPCVAATGQSLKGGQVLHKLLTSAGWQVLDSNDLGNGQGTVWSEFGDIDSAGHHQGWKLAKMVDTLIDDIVQRVWQLLASGWESVQIVTDHGWLLFPGGLPKVDLPSALADNKWGRCAAIKVGATTAERLYPWYWNPDLMFALADGISCFRAGVEYAHGGLSLQECLMLRLTVSLASAVPTTRAVTISEISWKGLRCAVIVEGESVGLTADIRTQPGNAASSIVVNPKPFRKDGVASLVVENEDLAGVAAVVVVFDLAGQLLAQAPTIVGGD